MASRCNTWHHVPIMGRPDHIRKLLPPYISALGLLGWQAHASCAENDGKMGG